MPTQDRSDTNLAAAQVAALTVGPEHNTHFDNLFKVCMNMLVSIIPQSTDIPKAYTSATSADDQDFVQNLALFLTAFFKVERSYASIMCRLQSC